jgi:hypothetical protein
VVTTAAFTFQVWNGHTEIFQYRQRIFFQTIKVITVEVGPKFTGPLADDL